MALTVAPARAPVHARENARKIFPAKIPLNPLISHDSDERIQGNPKESNSHQGGVSQAKP
jgi:hypothetical protein